MHGPLRQFAASLTTLMLLLVPMAPLQAEEASALAALQKARRTGRGYLQRGDYQAALRYLRSAVSRYPSEAELCYLLGAALLDRAIELDNDAQVAQDRLWLIYTVRFLAHQDHSGDFKDALPRVDAASNDATRAYRDACGRKAEAQALLDEAARAAATAMALDRGSEPALLLAFWIDGYRLIDEATAQKTRRYFQAQEARGAAPPPAVWMDEQKRRMPLDAEKVRKSALGVLAAWSKAHPEDALPYLAAAEWLQLTGRNDPYAWTALERLRISRYQWLKELWPGGEADAAALAIYKLLQRQQVSALTDISADQLLALYERAVALDPEDRRHAAYGLYVQLLPCDRTRAGELLAALAKREPSSALVPLERARLSVAGDKDYAALLRYLNEASGFRRLERPLFMTLPPEIREAFLRSDAVWPALEDWGFGMKWLVGALSKLARGFPGPISALPGAPNRLSRSPQAASAGPAPLSGALQGSPEDGAAGPAPTPPRLQLPSELETMQRTALRLRLSPDRQRANLLKATLGALLMRSDLPHDWVTGAEIRRDALNDLLQVPEVLPANLAPRLRLELADTRAQIASRRLPLAWVLLSQGQLWFVPVLDPGLNIVGSSIMVELRGGNATIANGG